MSREAETVTKMERQLAEHCAVFLNARSGKPCRTTLTTASAPLEAALPKKNNMQLFRENIPNFCWQTSYEILTMLEQVGGLEEIQMGMVHTYLFQLVEEGTVEERPVKFPHVRRRFTRGRGAEFEYKHVSLLLTTAGKEV